MAKAKTGARPVEETPPDIARRTRRLGTHDDIPMVGAPPRERKMDLDEAKKKLKLPSDEVIRGQVKGKDITLWRVPKKTKSM